MKSKRFIGRFMVVTALTLIFFQPYVNAQDQEITDEDLKSYSVIQNAVDMITSSISPAVNDMIRKQEGMTSQRFNELRKAGNNEARLKEAGAQDWEIQFMSKVNKVMTDRTGAAQEIINILINNSNMTAAKYSAIKKGLESDEGLKARYEKVSNGDE